MKILFLIVLLFVAVAFSAPSAKRSSDDPDKEIQELMKFFEELEEMDLLTYLLNEILGGPFIFL